MTHNTRVVDLRIEEVNDGFLLYIPISTGSLELRMTPNTTNLEVGRFLQNAIACEPRRFGENPKSAVHR